MKKNVLNVHKNQMPASQPENEDLSPKQVALALGVSEASLKRWCDKGFLDSTRTAGAMTVTAVVAHEESPSFRDLGRWRGDGCGGGRGERGLGRHGGDRRLFDSRGAGVDFGHARSTAEARRGDDHHHRNPSLHNFPHNEKTKSMPPQLV